MPNITPTLLAVAAALAAVLPAGAATATQEDRAQQAESSSQAEVVDIATLRERVSAWKLRTTTDATWPDAWKELASLRDDAEAAALDAPNDEALRSLLSDLQARAILWSMRRGDVDAASEWIVALRLTMQEKNGDPRRTLSLAAAMTMARADVQGVVASLPAGAQRAALPKAAGHSEDIVISRAVRQAVTRGDSAFMSKLGARAAPTLADLAREMDGSPIPTGQTDPLKMLVWADVATALDVSVELLQRDEYLLKKAVIEALKERSAFGYREVWLPVGESDWRLARPEWIQILQLLMTPADEASKETAEIVVEFAQRGRVPAGLVDACVDLFARSDRYPQPSPIPESALPVFRSMLRHPNAAVRRAAALTLKRSRYADVLLGAAEDPDHRIREIVALAMNEFSYASWGEPSRNSRSDGPPQRLEPTAAYSAALARLLVDPNERVRHHAYQALYSQSEARKEAVLDGPTIRALIPNIDAERQGRVTSIIKWLPEAERLPTLLEFVRATAALELEPRTMSDELDNYLGLDEYGLDPRVAFWPVVEEIERRAGFPDDLRELVASYATHYVKKYELPPGPVLDWLEENATTRLWENLIGSRYRSTSRGLDGYWIEKLTSSERLRLLVMLDGHVYQVNGIGNPPAVENFGHGGGLGIEPDDLLDLIRNTSAPNRPRQWAVIELSLVAPAAMTPDLVPTFIEIAGAHAQNDLRHFWRNPDQPELALDVLDGLVADRTVPDDWLLSLRLRTDRASTVEGIIRRYPTDTWVTYQQSNLLENVVRSLVRLSPDAPDPRLASANISRSGLQQALAEGLLRVRAEAYFPLLADVLRESWPGSSTYNTAVDAVTSYLDDDAAALLLETAKRLTSGDSRQAVLDRLDQITAYQDAAARWQRSRDAAAKRSEAIAELVALYEDQSQELTVRAEALRGLGLLGAVEELPRIVRALASTSAELKAAAKDAIDRLNDEGDASDDDR